MDLGSIEFQLPDFSPPIIAIIGPPGVGKTTVGKTLAQLLGYQFFDADALIETQAGYSISQIFENYGESCFRELEQKLLKALCKQVQILDINEKPLDGTVIACGGGLPVYKNNFKLLSSIATIIGLEASLDTLVNRVSENYDRPLLAKVEQPNGLLTDKPDQIICKQNWDSSLESKEKLISKMQSLIDQRKTFYGQADINLSTENKNVLEIAYEIKQALSLRRCK